MENMNILLVSLSTLLGLMIIITLYLMYSNKHLRIKIKSLNSIKKKHEMITLFKEVINFHFYDNFNLRYSNNILVQSAIENFTYSEEDITKMIVDNVKFVVKRIDKSEEKLIKAAMNFNDLEYTEYLTEIVRVH